MMERIVYLDRSVLRTAVRRPAFEHEWIEYPTTRPEVVKARLEGATIAITHWVFLNGEDLPPTLGLIAVGANLIVTPHVAWASQGALADLAEQLIQNIEGFVLGSPRNLVA